MWLVVGLIVVAVVVALIVIPMMRRSDEARAERRRRYELPESADRVPLMDPADTATDPRSTGIVDEHAAAFMARAAPETMSTATEALPEASDLPVPDFSEPGGDGEAGRLVMTPDGEMILTRPPFLAKGPLFTERDARVVEAIAARLPHGVVLCPKVRLESLLQPTSPAGYDPDDWRTWRRRVRLRAVDMLLCDAATWQPLVVVQLPRSGHHVRRIAGGEDKIIDEVLAAAGIALVRCRGDVDEDWLAIAPYLSKAESRQSKV